MRTRTVVPQLALVMLAVPLLAAPVSAAYDSGYSYVRLLDGRATLAEGDRYGDARLGDAAENQPLLPGDRLLVQSDSRLEAVLSDGTVLRLGGGSAVGLISLGWTPDTEDESTVLRLERGDLQLVGRPEELVGSGTVEVRTANASVYLDVPGRYYLYTDGNAVTEVTVREGYAEIATERGSSFLRLGERALVEGARWPEVTVARAGALASLEHWGLSLEEAARYAYTDYLEPGLRYRAAPLVHYGAWISVGGQWAWRPRVEAGWRPYYNGAWRYTPSGLTWVSSEPWGWVPYHYGTWSYVGNYGWLWYPGAVYAPAWVYWYWGPTHVAWVPSGYYTSFYAGWGGPAYPSWGVYGWAGGSWGRFSEWVFCPVGHFGRHGQQQFYKTGAAVTRFAGDRELPRGVIATDTRAVGSGVFRDPGNAVGRLAAVRTRSGGAAELSDVSAFVARRSDLSEKVAAEVRPLRDGRQAHATAWPNGADRAAGRAVVSTRSSAPDRGDSRAAGATVRQRVEAYRGRTDDGFAAYPRAGDAGEGRVWNDGQSDGRGVVIRRFPAEDGGDAQVQGWAGPPAGDATGYDPRYDPSQGYVAPRPQVDAGSAVRHRSVVRRVIDATRQSWSGSASDRGQSAASASGNSAGSAERRGASSSRSDGSTASARSNGGGSSSATARSSGGSSSRSSGRSSGRSSARRRSGSGGGGGSGRDDG